MAWEGGALGHRCSQCLGRDPHQELAFLRLPRSQCANSGPQREGSGFPHTSEQKAGLGCGHGGSGVSWRVFPGAQGRSPEGKPQLASSLNSPHKALVLPRVGGGGATLGL